jgi:hypothetical protein
LHRENAGAEKSRQQQRSNMPHIELRLLGDEILASRAAGAARDALSLGASD